MTIATTSTTPATEADLERLLLRTLKGCWGSIFSRALRRTLPGHLTPQQLFVLAHLCRQAAQPSELARDHHVGMSAMTGLIDGLVQRGFVERHPDPRDRRAVQLLITPAGRELLGEAEAGVLESARQLLSPLSAAQRERLHLALADLDRLLDPPEGCPVGPAASAPSAPGARN